jgi:hypothetical protein
MFIRNQMYDIGVFPPESGVASPSSLGMRWGGAFCSRSEEGLLEPLPLGPVNPKHEILKSLMWDMGYEICAGTRLFADGFYLTSQISHLRSHISHLTSHISHPHLKRHSHSNMTTPTGRCFSQRNEYEKVDLVTENSIFAESGTVHA